MPPPPGESSKDEPLQCEYGCNIPSLRYEAAMKVRNSLNTPGTLSLNSTIFPELRRYCNPFQFPFDSQAQLPAEILTLFSILLISALKMLILLLLHHFLKESTFHFHSFFVKIFTWNPHHLNHQLSNHSISYRPKTVFPSGRSSSIVLKHVQYLRSEVDSVIVFEICVTEGKETSSTGNRTSLASCVQRFSQGFKP